MAKKTAVKNPKPDAPVNAEAGYIQTIVISAVIFVAAIILGVVYTSVRSSQLEKAARVQVQQQAVEQPAVSPEIDPTTGAPRYTAQSAAQAAANAAAVAARGAANSAPTTVPVAPATPTPADPAVRCKPIVNQDVDSKANIWRIDYEDAKFLYDNHNVLFVDARGANEYAEAHIKGAINIPVNTTKEELDKMAGQLKGKVLITYCHGIGCHLSDKTAYMLFDNGYKKVAIFFGGWPKWNEHNGPIDKK